MSAADYDVLIIASLHVKIGLLCGVASFLSRDGPGEQSALTGEEGVSSARLGGWGDVVTDICSRRIQARTSFLSLISQRLFF